MIIHLKNNLSREAAANLAEKNQAIIYESGGAFVLVTSSKIKNLPNNLTAHTDEYFAMDSDIQLAGVGYRPEKRRIDMPNFSIGGSTKNTVIITGPCSIESREQITQCADLLANHNLTTLRAGCFKPRTSPYTFQGLGAKGLEMLAEIRDAYGLNIITEVKDSSHVDLVIEKADIIQIGAKAMYDQSILRKCGTIQKPVLLKRGFGTTLQEFVQAAEFILSGGNPNVILCERGIRTFETKTRFTLDLCGVAFLKEYTNLPVVVDPSHALGYRYGIADLTRAAIAMGVDGLLIETHPTPETAKSDAAQQLNFEQFEEMFATLHPVAKAVGYNLV